MVQGIQSNLGPAWEPGEGSWDHMVSSMMVAEEVGIKMMKEYFEIEASKATPQ